LQLFAAYKITQNATIPYKLGKTYRMMSAEERVQNIMKPGN